MNEVALKGILKLLKTIVSPEQITQLAQSFIQMAIENKNSIVLDTEAGETGAGYFAYEVSGVSHFCIIVLNANNQVTRFEQVQQLDSLIENIIKKL